MVFYTYARRKTYTQISKKKKVFYVCESKEPLLWSKRRSLLFCVYVQYLAIYDSNCFNESQAKLERLTEPTKKERKKEEKTPTGHLSMCVHAYFRLDLYMYEISVSG